ncbi:MAG: VCBS repeat-containing protein [Bacteroidaceae bacterium]|nr:VCBS repeat-containing protein [Bacteroidaceae bacterium]
MKRVAFFTVLLTVWLPLLSLGHWWKETLVIGAYHEPPLWDAMDTVAFYHGFEDARDRGFNLFLGIHFSHTILGNTFEIDAYNYHKLYRNVAVNNDNLYFFEINENSDSIIDAVFRGVIIMDEPKTKQKSDVDSAILSARLRYRGYVGDFLPLVNLLPSEAKEFDDWASYCTYVDAYASDTSFLPVICFDNYHQDRYFTPSLANAKSKYFSNLALMRDKAGNRPLWSFVSTTEWMTLCDSSWQKAYMRLGAFAPLAYGAKGIIYYNYDCEHPFQIRTFIRRDSSVFSSDIFSRLTFSTPPSENYKLFYGHFDTETTADYRHADVALKTDDGLGTWRLWFARCSKVLVHDEWNRIMSGYGESDYSRAFIADWDNDGIDNLATIVSNGQFLLTTTNTGWNRKAILQNFAEIGLSNILDGGIVAGNIDGDSQGDLCIGYGNSVRFYWNHNGGFGDGAFETYSVDTVPQLKYLVGAKKSNEKMCIHAIRSSGDGLFLRSCSASTQTTSWTADRKLAGLKGRIHHAAVIGDTLYVQMQEPNRFKGDISGTDSILMNSDDDIGPRYFRHDVEYYGTQGHDSYYIPAYGTAKVTSALLDSVHGPSPRMGYAEEINRYIRTYIEPVVMHARWVGTWHALPVDTLDEHVQHAGSEFIIDSLSENLMAGLFAHADTAYTLLVVNKSNTSMLHPCVRIKGYYGTTPRMLPRIGSGSTDLTRLTHSAMTTLAWDSIHGGECVILRMSRQKDYFRTHRSSYFDTDERADLNFRYDNNGHGLWCVDTKTNGFGSWDSVFYDYGTRSISTPVLADYTGDGITDLTIHQFLPTNILRIDNSGTPAHSWSIVRPIDGVSAITPFIGDFDGDGSSDFCYRDEARSVLYFLRSGDDFVLSDSLLQYGTAAATLPACGDYDGDGADELALLRTNERQLLVDWAYNGHLGWDTVFYMYNIPSNADFCKSKIIISDFDGDGRADFSYLDTAAHKWQCDYSCNGFSNGSGFDKTVYFLDTTFSVSTNVDAVASDFDGDGRADLVLYLSQVGDDDPVSVLIYYSIYDYGLHYYYSMSKPHIDDYPIAF